MSNVSKRPLLRRVERWLVGFVMAAMAYMIEKVVLQSIRRGQVKPKSPGDAQWRRTED